MKASEPLPGWVFHAIQNDPAFRVLTMDGVHWIDPYTGAIIPAPFGYDDVARKHFAKHKPWGRFQPKTLVQLLTLRWFHYLRENLEFVGSLRVFNNGMWLNPYTGAWVAGIPLENDKVTLRTIEHMAHILAESKEAQTGKMLEAYRLDRLISDGPAPKLKSSARLRPSTAKPLKAPVKGVKQATDFHHIKQMLIKMLARPPRIEGWQIIVHYEPHSAISRDFYDIIELPGDRLLMVIGDITGQGPGSALVVAATLKSLRLVAKKHSDLIDIVGALNDEVRPDLMQDCSITLFAALVDTKRRSLTYISSGHHPGVLLNQNRETPMQQLVAKGEPMGPLTSDQFRRAQRPVSMHLEVGDILLMYSDGLFKVANSRKEEFGKFRLLGSCVSNLGRPCGELVNQVLEDAKAHASGRLAEDMTVLALRVKEPTKSGDQSSFNETWLGKTQLP